MSTLRKAVNAMVSTQSTSEAREFRLPIVHTESMYGDVFMLPNRITSVTLPRSGSIRHLTTRSSSHPKRRSIIKINSSRPFQILRLTLLNMTVTFKKTARTEKKKVKAKEEEKIDFDWGRANFNKDIEASLTAALNKTPQLSGSAKSVKLK